MFAKEKKVEATFKKHKEVFLLIAQEIDKIENRIEEMEERITKNFKLDFESGKAIFEWLKDIEEKIDSQRNEYTLHYLEMESKLDECRCKKKEVKKNGNRKSRK